MGNAGTRIRQWIQIKQDTDYFKQQQQVEYSYEVSHQCIQHLAELNLLFYNSLKKVHRYLHPAVKAIQCSTGDFEEIHSYLLLRQDSLTSSAINVINMYSSFLQKVVPTNITYFHFMREKDLYTHYIAILYTLKYGYLNPTHNLYTKLTIEQQVMQLKLLAHWLYDMVKYFSSAIYIDSPTMPHLIRVLYAYMCGILLNGQVLSKYEDSEREQLYEHVMYSSTFMVCWMTESGEYGMVEVVCGCIGSLMKQMGQAAKPEVYAPSFWYAGRIGYVPHPLLEKVCVLSLLNILPSTKVPMHSMKFFHEDDENTQTAEQILSAEHMRSHEEETSPHIHKSAVLWLFYSVGCILESNAWLGHQKMVVWWVLRETESVPVESLVRAMVLWVLGLVDVPENSRAGKFLHNSSMPYQVGKQLFTWRQVQQECMRVLINDLRSTMHNYQQQGSLSQRDIWKLMLEKT